MRKVDGQASEDTPAIRPLWQTSTAFIVATKACVLLGRKGLTNLRHISISDEGFLTKDASGDLLVHINRKSRLLGARSTVFGALDPATTTRCEALVTDLRNVKVKVVSLGWEGRSSPYLYVSLWCHLGSFRP